MKQESAAAQALQKDLAASSAGRLLQLQRRQPGVDAFFEHVNTQPMASASIAQVSFEEPPGHATWSKFCQV